MAYSGKTWLFTHATYPLQGSWKPCSISAPPVIRTDGVDTILNTDGHCSKKGKTTFRSWLLELLPERVTCLYCPNQVNVVVPEFNREGTHLLQGGALQEKKMEYLVDRNTGTSGGCRCHPNKR